MSWNDDIAYAMTPFKFLTLPLGVWPLQKYNTFSLARCFVCGIGMAALAIVTFFEFNFGSSDAYVKIEDLLCIYANIIGILKLLTLRLHAENLTYYFSSAVNDYLAIDNEEKRIIMRRHAFMGRIICYSLVPLTYLAILFITLTPMVTHYNEDIQVNVTIKFHLSELPFPITFLGHMQIPTGIYFAISTMEFLITAVIVASNCGNDALFAAIILHICGQMELLKIEFTKYGMTNKNENENFLVLVLRHRFLMEHAELLSDVISFVVLTQILFNCVLISLYGYQLFLAMKVVLIVRTTILLIVLLLEMFVYTFVGDYLKCQMEEIADSIYSSNWYCLPAKLMRNVLFVIMRSQQPVQLLAGKFFIVNIKTFMTILRTSLSYFSVLRVMMDA
ncbi:odorant receptor 4-like [Solenopsis invicta]|uniref:odorant receptor 4-like n=1 Tax=Solenopsis invicta TaxID=13686 RepID=UPI00193CC0AE|nr:odorant receptor 4-like [Solenopsis invicta]